MACSPMLIGKDNNFIIFTFLFLINSFKKLHSLISISIFLDFITLFINRNNII